jgi:hypothetical protein
MGVNTSKEVFWEKRGYIWHLQIIQNAGFNTRGKVKENLY